MRSKAWWAILGCSSVGWAMACAPIVTVADGGDAGGAGEESGESGSGGTGGTWGGGAMGGIAGGGFAGTGTAGGGSGGTAGNAQTAGAPGSTVRDATEEENTVPEGCAFTFGPADPGGDGEAPADPPECGCTRRPGDGTSFQCPWGEGVTVSAAIGPEGGTIFLRETESTKDSPLELRIPRNALTETVTISITELSVAPPDGVNDWSPLYRFEPADLEFQRPVELALPWTGLGGFVTDLTLYFSSEAGGSCDMTALSDNFVSTGFNQGSLTHLGWAIVGRPLQDGCP